MESVWNASVAPSQQPTLALTPARPILAPIGAPWIDMFLNLLKQLLLPTLPPGQAVMRYAAFLSCRKILPRQRHHQIRAGVLHRVTDGMGAGLQRRQAQTPRARAAHGSGPKLAGGNRSSTFKISAASCGKPKSDRWSSWKASVTTKSHLCFTWRSPWVLIT